MVSPRRLPPITNCCPFGLQISAISTSLKVSSTWGRVVNEPQLRSSDGRSRFFFFFLNLESLCLLYSHSRAKVVAVVLEHRVATKVFFGPRFTDASCSRLPRYSAIKKSRNDFSVPRTSRCIITLPGVSAGHFADSSENSPDFRSFPPTQYMSVIFQNHNFPCMQMPSTTLAGCRGGWPLRVLQQGNAQ